MALLAAGVKEHLEQIVQSQVQSLFKRASDIFSEETEAESRQLKNLFYVAQMLRRFDPCAENLGLEVQLCPEDCDKVFLRVLWTFPNGTVVNYWWNCEGCRRVPLGWQFGIPAKIYDVFCFPTVNSNRLDTKFTTQLLLTCWGRTTMSGVFSMLF